MYRLKNILFVVICVFVFAACLSAQKRDDATLKSEIEKDFKAGEILKINNIINANSFLSPEYTLTIINRNIQYTTDKNDLKNLGYSYITLGNFWIREGNKFKAFECFSKAQEYAYQTNDLKRLGILAISQANILDSLDQKITKYNQAIDILKQEKDSMNLIRTYLNMGYAYTENFKQKKTDQYRTQAFKNYDLAENLNKKFKNKEMEALLNYRKAEWMQYDEKYAAAEDLLLNARKIYEEKSMLQWMVYCDLDLAFVYNKQKRFDLAVSLLQKTEKIVNEFQFLDQLEYLYQLYQEVYTDMGDYKQALKYADLYQNTSVAQNEKNSQDKIQALELDNRMSEKQREIEVYRQERKIYLIVIASVLFILVLGFSLFYVGFQNKKRKLINIQQEKIITEIQLKNQLLQEELLIEKVKYNQEHLIFFANQVSQIDAFLDEIKVLLKKLNISPEYMDSLNVLKFNFSELLAKQISIKHIGQLNTEINQDFFRIVRKENGNITPGEEQLLSFLINNKSSKEIAEVLKITTESVLKKRYRLRKKLNMQSEESFKSFYLKIIPLIGSVSLTV